LSFIIFTISNVYVIFELFRVEVLVLLFFLWWWVFTLSCVNMLTVNTFSFELILSLVFQLLVAGFKIVFIL